MTDIQTDVPTDVLTYVPTDVQTDVQTDRHRMSNNINKRVKNEEFRVCDRPMTSETSVFRSIWTNDAIAMASGFWRRDSGIAASGFAEYRDGISPTSYWDLRRRRIGIFWNVLVGFR